MNTPIAQADRARIYWLENFLDAYDFVLLLPHRDDALNRLLLDAFRMKLQGLIDAESGLRPEAVVLTPACVTADAFYTVKTISEETVKSLIALYCLYEFTDKVIIGSFDLPYGRKLRNFLDCGLASEKELADMVIFQK